MFLRRRHACPHPALLGACVLLGLGIAAGQAPVAASPAEARPAAASKAPPDSAAPTAAAALRPGRDPLDHLRERLAEKLGGEAGKRGSKAKPITVKVVNKVEADDAPVPARPPRAASARPGPPADATLAALGASPEHAARLAAIQREAGEIGHAAAGSELHWAYQGEGGPPAWGQLKPEFATCGNGKRQSPIDIRDGLKLELEPVQFDYQPSPVRVIDNGHTVQVNVAEGNHIEVMGRRYQLRQFHFHRPSEERIDGRQFDMVAHLVHQDSEGRLAVVAVLLSRGAAQPVIQTVWNNLPLEKGEEQPVRNPLDLQALLPEQRQYFTYMGSLTTPPCTEGVLWMVMKTPVQVSAEQVHIFSRLYPMNARPLQSASGRLIKESN